jgi:hypothetical protein
VSHVVEPTDQQIEDRVRRDFPADRRGAILMMLKTFGGRRPARTDERFLQMAVLRIVDGREDLLDQWLDLAAVDPREVLRAATGLNRV